MPDLEPITREEMLLDGQDLEPITRKEMFIKRIYDKTQVIPEPITREEMFLKKAGEGESDVDIKQLSVTENGTYSEEGTAYSPVIVNVPAPPIPDNAYLLNDLSGLPTNIATFTDGSNLPMPRLKVGIEPIQEGSGDPSPSNVRPISGWTGAEVSVCGTNLWDGEYLRGAYSNTGSFSLSDNYISSKNQIRVKPNTSFYFRKISTCPLYYCEYDIDGTFLRRIVDATAFSGGKVITTSTDAYFINFSIGGSGSQAVTSPDGICLNYPSTDTSYHAYNGQTTTIQFKDGSNPLTVYGGSLDVTSGVLTVTDGYIASYNGETLPSTWISDRDVYAEGTTPTTGAEVCYELSTPQTYQLTPTQVNSLIGSNNVWADCGQIEELEYFSKEV